MPRAPTTSAKKKAKAKRKPPARRCSFAELKVFIAALYIAANARDGPDCVLTAEEKFAAFQADMCDLVNKVGDYLGVNLSFTPVNLPVGATWDSNGLRGAWMLVLGHFETAAIGLFGSDPEGGGVWRCSEVGRLAAAQHGARDRGVQLDGSLEHRALRRSPRRRQGHLVRVAGGG